MTGSDFVHVRAATHPLRVGRVDACVVAGRSLDQMFSDLQPDPVLRRAAHIYVGSHYVPRENWARVRPRPGAIVTIRAFLPPEGGGGGGGGKNPLRLILTLAVIALAFAAPLALPLIGLSAGATILGTALTVGQLATAVVGFAGLLLVNVIAPIRPPKLPTLSASSAGSVASSPTLFLEGARNQARPFGTVPVVLGRHRVVPPLGARPYTEVVGDQNYLRMIFVWGVGPLELSDFRIGETDLALFEGVEVEHRQGLPGDAPLTLFPSSVDQQDLQVKLTTAANWQVRTTSADADEISVDVTFPRGLFGVASNGTRLARSVTLQVQYAVKDSGAWLPLPTAGGVRTFPDSWIDDLGTDQSVFGQVTFTHQKDAAVRHGLTWKVPARGQYDVRVRRIGTEELADSTTFDEVFWTALRRITNADPISSPVPLAKTALRIRATDQLSGIVDEFNGIAHSVCPDLNDTTPTGWTARATNNPASLFRQVLQGNGLQAPLADARLDLANLADFHDWCAANGYTFNMVRDFGSSVWDTLADVASAGRATPAQVDGKWGVIIDRPQAIPASHVTPRNSSNFTATKLFADHPHGFRVRFPNEDMNYRQDERIIYRDGYTAANATKFETIELPGVTDPDLVWKHGRFHLASAELRPERWTFEQQMEHLAYRRGDRILITHDVLLVGLASGRIKSVVTNGAGGITGLVVDEALVMETGRTYGVSIRTPTNAQVTATLVTNPGSQTTVQLAAPIPAVPGPAPGDLFGFGELGAVTEDAVVLGIEPRSENRALITAVPYRAAIYTADTGAVPTFTTNLTPLPTVPAPVILRAVSDESMLVYGPGESLQARIALEVQSLADTSGVNDLSGELDVQMRPSLTGEPFTFAIVDRRTPEGVIVSGVRTGETWDLRARWRVEGRLPGPWTTVFNHRVVGRSGAPNPLASLTISAFGGQALLRWARPTELDVVTGGEVRFRHSSAMSGATWETSTSIGEVARARDLVASLPLKEGTYLARVFDVDGNSSSVALVTTKQASVLTFAAATTLDEAPLFAGAHENTLATGGVLKLNGAGLFDDIADLDAEPSLDAAGGLVVAGTYYFALGFDLGSVKKVRLTTRIAAQVVNEVSSFDDREENIDDWENFDGTGAGSADALIYVRHTDDDPDLSGASWSSWERLDSAEFIARGFEFRAVLASSDPTYNIYVSELGVDSEELA